MARAQEAGKRMNQGCSLWLMKYVLPGVPKGNGTSIKFLPHFLLYSFLHFSPPYFPILLHLSRFHPLSFTPFFTHSSLSAPFYPSTRPSRSSLHHSFLLPYFTSPLPPHTPSPSTEQDPASTRGVRRVLQTVSLLLRLLEKVRGYGEEM